MSLQHTVLIGSNPTVYRVIPYLIYTLGAIQKLCHTDRGGGMADWHTVTTRKGFAQALCRSQNFNARIFSTTGVGHTNITRPEVCTVLVKGYGHNHNINPNHNPKCNVMYVM